MPCPSNIWHLSNWPDPIEFASCAWNVAFVRTCYLSSWGFILSTSCRYYVWNLAARCCLSILLQLYCKQGVYNECKECYNGKTCQSNCVLSCGHVVNTKMYEMLCSSYNLSFKLQLHCKRSYVQRVYGMLLVGNTCQSNKLCPILWKVTMVQPVNQTELGCKQVVYIECMNVTMVQKAVNQTVMLQSAIYNTGLLYVFTFQQLRGSLFQ